MLIKGTPSFRDIEFSKKSFANVTGNGSGSIAIKGRTINFNSESVLLANTLGDRNGGEISIVGDSINFNRSGVFSNTFSSGDSGRIKLEATNNIEFKDSSTLTIQTWDKGKAGDININANSFQFKGQTIKSEVQEGSTGRGGEINITANSLEVLQNPQDQPTVISTATFGKGDAGNINIDIKGPFTLVGSITSESTGAGNAGKININANSLGMEGSYISSKATSAGQAGKIDLNVANSLAIKGSWIITSTFDGTGEAGTININANSFQLVGGRGITSEAQGNSTGKGGNINITIGSLGLLKSLISTATTGIGDAGDINIDVKGQLTVASPISTNTDGAGNAGKININANSLQIDGTSVSSSVTKTSTGQGGEINFHVADSLTINKSGITTSTDGTGNAGTININANSFQFKGLIQSEARQNSTGKGGEINITANSLELPKNPDPKDDTRISTTTAGIGDAGNINIKVTGPLTVASGAKITEITTSSSGNGKAGNLKISADTIKLDNSLLNANTSGGEGNISVNSRDLILRNNGKITTNATGTANGGNIEINNTGNLVVFEDSKITANAEKGYGGTVNITAQGIFRSPDNITAISEAGLQFNGIVQFNTPDIDPTRGLFELSETVIDPAQQIAQNVCTKGFGSTFTITGRGGFPSDPTKILSSDNVRVDLVKPVPSTVSSTSTTQKQPSKSPTVKEIIPARGWIFNEKGEVLLVGYDPTKTGPQRKQPAPASSCAATR